MPIFRFKRIARIEHTITVCADDYNKAFAKAAVGGMDWVKEKEGVEITDYSENTQTVDFGWCTGKIGDDVSVEHDTYEEAVNWIDNQSKIDPVGVNNGDYYID